MRSHTYTHSCTHALIHPQALSLPHLCVAGRSDVLLVRHQALEHERVPLLLRVHSLAQLADVKVALLLQRGVHAVVARLTQRLQLHFCLAGNGHTHLLYKEWGQGEGECKGL